MSQLPPPNFDNFTPAFNTNGFPASWPMGTPSIFGRPQNPSLGFPPRLPMNSFNGYAGCQFRPGIWPNVNSVHPQQNHVDSREGMFGNHYNSYTQQQPQASNFQGKANEIAENGQPCPLNKIYSCDACHKDFNSKQTLDAHLSSHVQCSYEGCTFKAARKVLKLHWIQTHETGRMRIKLDTPEEIAKWKEDRKRKYPTLANVEKKMEEEAKRRESGHVLKTKNFRYRRGQRGGRGFHRGGHNHFNNRSQTWKTAEGPSDTSMAKTSTTEHSKDKNQDKTLQDSKRLENGEDPLSMVLDDCCEEDNERGSGIKERLSAQKMSPNLPLEAGPSNPSSDISALGSLCSAYASDSEDDEKPGEINNNKHTDCPQIGKDAKSCSTATEVRMSVDGTCTSETGQKVKQEAHTRTRPRKRSRKNNSKANAKSLGIRKSTLLEKLLAPDVRHERNVILQCLRHIVKKNFFDVDMKPSFENNVKSEFSDEFVNKS